jgi:2-keto-4-pentenoate hydratase/2-oxohepta-3-ene-1,7-dioic acid hydratase in catechol pathway
MYGMATKLLAVASTLRSIPGIAGEVVPEWYQAPTFYFTNPYALIGAHDDVPVPPGCEMLDFELEVAVVVGRDGASLSAEQAREHIFGYTVLNDWSARDLQRREMKAMLGPAKGELVGQDLLSNMGWPFEELIAYASRGTEVRPGDIVELTVEGIGTVRNRVVPGPTLPPVRAARARSVLRVRKRG